MRVPIVPFAAARGHYMAQTGGEWGAGATTQQLGLDALLSLSS